MERLIWMLSPAPDPPRVEQVGKFSGSYVAAMDGGECLLELWFEGGGFVHGAMTADGETLDVRGGFSGRDNTLKGFLLEPYSHVPVAVFGAEVRPEGLSLRIGTPGLEGWLGSSVVEKLELTRVAELPDWSGILDEGERRC